MSVPLLSIVIPTKNRNSTLFSVVEYLLSIKDIEIVIQDNSDDNTEALNFFEKKKDFPNLKYFYESGKLSVIQNSDKAVLHSTGEYVCFIGDDDGVMPYIVDVVKWMQQNNIYVLNSYKPNYLWIGQISGQLSSDVSGVLKYNTFNYHIDVLESQNALKFLLKKGGTLMIKVPCLYHGIVKREILDKIYNKCGTYFPGPSPDMANATALVKSVDKYAFSSFPVFISGNSPHSTGGMGIRKKHLAKIEDVPHIPENTSKNWTELIPKYWTGPTIWAESLLKTLEKYEDDQNIKKFRYSYLYASLYVFNFKLRNVIFSENLKPSLSDFNFVVDFVRIFLFRVKTFIFNRVRRSHSNLKNIQESINVLLKEIDMDRVREVLNKSN